MTSARARIAAVAASWMLVLAVPIGTAGAASSSKTGMATTETASACAEAEQALASTRGIPIRLCPSLPQPAKSAPAESSPIPSAAGPCHPDIERCEAWVSAPYDGPAEGWDFVGERVTTTGSLAGNALATTMDGKRVFTAGASEREGGQWAVATLAYKATDGTRLWEHTVEPSEGATELNAVSVVAGTDAVFVTGYALNGGEGVGFTRAYDAATGATLWHATFPGWANHSAISDDGTRVFVIGDAPLPNGVREGRIVSYDSDTGEQMWMRTLVDPQRRFLMPWRIDSAADRLAVAIARVETEGPEAGTTTAVYVVTYDATGEQEGTPVTNVTSDIQGTLPAGIALNGDGSKAFVAQSVLAPPSLDTPTYVFGVDTAAGDLAWGQYFLGWDRNENLATATYPWHTHPIEVSPQGSVILSAYSLPHQTVTIPPLLTAYTNKTGAFVTASLNPVTGSEEWRTWEPATVPDSSPVGLIGPTVSVNPGTGQVVMAGAMLTGLRFRPVTYGYSPTGEREWMRISNELPKGSTLPVSEGWWSAVLHSPDGTRVFEAGTTSAIYNDPASSPDVILAAFDTAA
ncbi:MAG: PQQ-binding-like beta-propeller repeat protein [Actinomycetota bacterium]